MFLSTRNRKSFTVFNKQALWLKVRFLNRTRWRFFPDVHLKLRLNAGMHVCMRNLVSAKSKPVRVSRWKTKVLCMVRGKTWTLALLTAGVCSLATSGNLSPESPAITESQTVPVKSVSKRNVLRQIARGV